MAGIRRRLGTRQLRQEALTLEHIRSITFTDDPKGWRNKALLLVGFAGGFRRSELAAIRAEDIAETPDGIRITLQRSKSDQEGAGVDVDVVRAVSPASCPVVALEIWLTRSRIKSGPVFPSFNRGSLPTGKALSPFSVGQIVKWAAGECGFDPRKFGGHSLRAGAATYLLGRGKEIYVVADHLRHKSINTTRRYNHNATAKALKGVY